MARYRRTWVPGGTYFFTVKLLERRRQLLTRHIDALRDAFRTARDARPFTIIALVVLPDHIHCIWQLPEGDADNATRWRHIKSEFSRSIPATERLSPRRIVKSERGIWQRRFWERLIVNEADLHTHIDYVHINPLKHGWIARVRDWPYSSFHRHVRDGTYPIDWADDANQVELMTLPEGGSRPAL